MLSTFSIQNFRRFTDWSLKSIPSPLVISGDNGSGKTTVLWAVVLFFRGFNSFITSNRLERQKESIKVLIQNEKNTYSEIIA